MSILDTLLSHAVVPEENFAAAYAALSAMERAWIKQAISKWVTIYGSTLTKSICVEERWPGHLKLLRQKKPLDRVALMIMEDGFSWPQVLAAALPAFLAGVPEVAVCLPESAISFSLLLALELAGLEKVVLLSGKEMQDLVFSDQWQSETGLTITMGRLRPGMDVVLPASDNWLHLGTIPQVGVWLEDGCEFDFEMFKFAHGLSNTFFYAATTELRDRCSENKQLEVRVCAWERFVEQSFFALYLAGSIERDLPGSCQLVLREGQENFWLWPRLHSALFWQHCVDVAGFD